ncbi:MAG TPA: NAD(P)H-binding protein [Micromonosporaceae bacterium]|nr:NAD(P)H-binding protein [Micromonosporaceae bacterium]
MASPILVTGGTGTLGRLVVPRLRCAGSAVRVLSRREQPGTDDGIEFVVGDLSTGDGLDAAVAGIDVILHLGGTSSGDDVKARHLVRAAARAGARHLVFVSVVGADRVPVTGAVDRAMFGYFASKLAAERVVEESGLPWTTLRAAGRRRLVLPVRLPGRAARAFRDGANLAPEHATGRRTWEAFLATAV